MFSDRAEAGEKLAKRLLSHKADDVIVLALPRGGVVIGEKIARVLKAPLDVLAVRKVGHPSSPEYAIGAVYENGLVCMDDEWSADDAQVKRMIEKEQKESRRRGMVYRAGRPALNVAGKTVILVDDGVATGKSMKLAIMVVKALSPKRIVVAVPVASSAAVSDLMTTGAEVIVLEPPENFRQSVGAHYIEFPQVKDEEVIRIMHATQP